MGHLVKIKFTIAVAIFTRQSCFTTNNLFIRSDGEAPILVLWWVSPLLLWQPVPLWPGVEIPARVLSSGLFFLPLYRNCPDRILNSPEIYIYIYIFFFFFLLYHLFHTYLPTSPLGQDMTQGQFFKAEFNRFEFEVWIRVFLLLD